MAAAPLESEDAKPICLRRFVIFTAVANWVALCLGKIYFGSRMLPGPLGAALSMSGEFNLVLWFKFTVKRTFWTMIGLDSVFSFSASESENLAL